MWDHSKEHWCPIHKFSSCFLKQSFFHAELSYNKMNDIVDKTRIKLRTLNENTSSTCYEQVEKHNVPCQRKSCKNWIDFNRGHNCVKVSAKDGPLTLNEIGKIYGLTRMRICQIEKGIYQKIRKLMSQAPFESSS